MKPLLFFLLLAFLGTASVIKPDQLSHEKKIYETAIGSSAPPAAELYRLPEWEELKFRDFYFCTATQSKGRNSIVTFGFFRYIKVLDTAWWSSPLGKKSVPQE